VRLRRAAVVAMVKAADLSGGHDLTTRGCRDRPRLGRVVPTEKAVSSNSGWTAASQDPRGWVDEAMLVLSSQSRAGVDTTGQSSAACAIAESGWWV
jgi:hypothetical protein